MTFAPTAQRSRQVLAFLTDEGVVLSETGQAVVAVGVAVGISTNYASNIVKALADVEMVERDVVGKRTFRIAVTDKGRRELNRQATWSRRQERRRAASTARPTATAPPPPMPVLGRIGKLPFDPVATRERLAEGMPK